MVTRAKCTVCGKLTAICQPYGEGTAFFPRAHKHENKPCPGKQREAILVDVVDKKSALAQTAQEVK